MSQENVNFLTGLFAAADTLDRDAMLAALPALIEEVCDPDIEWVEDPQRADGRVYRGHAGVRESWERWLENFDEYGWKIERITDHGNRVLVVALEHARGTGSQVEVSARNYIVCSFRAGKISRYEEFYDEGQALRAAERSE